MLVDKKKEPKWQSPRFGYWKPQISVQLKCKIGGGQLKLMKDS